MKLLLALITLFTLTHGACYQPYPDPARPKSGEYLVNYEKTCDCTLSCGDGSFCTGFFIGKLITKVEWYQKFIKNKYCNVTTLASSYVSYTCKCPPNFRGQVYFEASLKVYTVVIPTTTVPKPTDMPSPRPNTRNIVIIVSVSVACALMLLITIISIIKISNCCKRGNYNSIL